MKIKQKYILLIINIFLSLSFLSCNQNQAHKIKISHEPLDLVKMPVVVPAGMPVIHLMSDFSPPAKIPVPPSAAKIKRADFYITMQNFNTDQGLALSTIICGYKDKAGNLWFGTSGNGVSKYDGKSFTNFYSSSGLIHNLINDITEDSKGNIWFATSGGLSRYDGVAFTNFTKADGLIDNDVRAILEDKMGNFWFGTYDGLSIYDGKSFKNYSLADGLPGRLICSIVEDHTGNIWIGTSGGLSQYHPGSEETGGKVFTKITTKNGLISDNLYALMEDQSGHLWIGTSEGISEYDPAKEGTVAGPFTNYTTADGLANNQIRCIRTDLEGNIWIGTDGGASRFNPPVEPNTKGSFFNLTAARGLGNKMVNSITLDNTGNLWFGTNGTGLCRFDGLSLISFSTGQGLPMNTVYSITEDSAGNKWFGGFNGGLIRYDGKSFTHFDESSGLLDNSLDALVTDKKNTLWIGTKNGLSKFDGKTMVNYTTAQGLIDDKIISLTEDREGNLWIGTYESGLSKFDGLAFTNYTTNQGLVHNTVWSTLEDEDGILWFGTRGGVSRFDGKTFTNFTKEQGLADSKVSKIIEDKKGNLLIGTWGGGISIVKKSTREELDAGNSPSTGEAIFQTFSTNEGLSNDVVYGILEDSIGNIFIGTNVGITVLKGGLDPTGRFIAQNGIENYNEKSGYPVKDISNNNSMFLDSKGIIWAGTGDKLIRFDYNKVHRSSNAPDVFITSIKINNESISWRSLERDRLEDPEPESKNIHVAPYITDELLLFGKKLSVYELDTMVNKFGNIRFNRILPFYSIPDNLVLPYSYNNITFDFLGIETSRPNLVSYQYFLVGHDKTWSLAGKRSTASFDNMPEGSYTLMIKARNPDGNWSDPITYHFKILPPWYRSTLAYLFYILLLFAGIFLVDRFQSRRLIAKERQKVLARELKQAREIEKAYDELKATQKQLIHAEKMASLGELVAGIAHEIQNPLNFVKNFSEVSMELLTEMKEELDLGQAEEAKETAGNVIENLGKISQHANRANSIVKGMLQHSRTASGVREPTDINALADEFLRLSYYGMSAKDKSFKAITKTDFDPAIGKIKIIPQDIGRVILNLFSNAFYAVNEKLRLIALDEQPTLNYEPTVTVSTKKIDGHVEISIRDNGTGIPQKVLDKIFLPFFTTKPSGEGTGLGLSLSYDIITKGHNGDIKVNTEEGVGTEFIIILKN